MDQEQEEWKKKNVTCYRCNRKGHYASQCNEKYDEKVCYNCGKKGHLQRECRSMGNRNYGRDDNRRNDNGRNGSGNNRNERRDLNFLSTTFEEEDVLNLEYSSDEEYSKDEWQMFDLRSGRKRFDPIGKKLFKK
jgi:hypothetical protein